MSNKNFDLNDLKEIVDGNIEKFIILLKEPRIIQKFPSLKNKLVLRADTLKSILNDFKEKKYEVYIFQKWAFFMRWGTIGTWHNVEGNMNRNIDICSHRRKNQISTKSVQIEYSSDHEDIIAHIISRLDELGDQIDGEISDVELNSMIESLEKII